MSFVIYDIETYKNDIAEHLIDQKSFEAPSNYKDPEKIKDAIAQKRKEALDRSALKWTTGKVVCICASVFPTGGVGYGGPKVFSHAGNDEPEILQNFSRFLDGIDFTLVGKSNHIFDDGFLIGRYLANDLVIPKMLLKKTFDINNIFGWGSNHPQQASLNEYAIALGIGEKSSDGSEVAAMVEKNDWDHIREYCSHDVELTKSIFERYLSNGGYVNV